MAKICLVLTADGVDENIALVEGYRDSIDMVELRVDLLDPLERAGAMDFPGRVRLPSICTIRRRSDGGKYEESEDERIALFESFSSAGFTYVDFELDFSAPGIVDRFVSRGARVIRSLHDFAGVPQDLGGVVESLSAAPGDIPKLAVNPKSFAEAARFYSEIRKCKVDEIIAIAMGSFGFFTRVFAEKLGSILTFASPAGESAAPGHVDPETLESVYRFRSISNSTRSLAVIGDPAMHSKSPHIHNPALSVRSIDSVYVPLHVDDPSSLFEYWDLLDLDGASVTVPHKERIIACLDSVDGAVSEIGSCNTVVKREGRFEGTNTDAPGLVAAIRSLAPNLPNAAVIVGAGGTARAAVYALQSIGAKVVIVNRTPGRARELAERYRCLWAPMDESSTSLIHDHSELIVQTTSAGMHPNEEIDPLEFYDFDGSETVLDVIYAPPVTRFLNRAIGAGCRTTNGWQMLLEQAYLQFELFTGDSYPVDKVHIPDPGNDL